MSLHLLVLWWPEQTRGRHHRFDPRRRGCPPIFVSRPTSERCHPACLILSTLGATLALFLCHKLNIHRFKLADPHSPPGEPPRIVGILQTTKPRLSAR